MFDKIKTETKKLNPSEMKKLKGGLADAAPGCRTGGCSYYEANTGTVNGTCQANSAGRCVCNAGSSSVVLAECVATTTTTTGGSHSTDSWGIASFFF